MSNVVDKITLVDAAAALHGSAGGFLYLLMKRDTTPEQLLHAMSKIEGCLEKTKPMIESHLKVQENQDVDLYAMAALFVSEVKEETN